MFTLNITLKKNTYEINERRERDVFSACTHSAGSFSPGKARWGPQGQVYVPVTLPPPSTYGAVTPPPEAAAGPWPSRGRPQGHGGRGGHREAPGRGSPPVHARVWGSRGCRLPPAARPGAEGRPYLVGLPHLPAAGALPGLHGGAVAAGSGRLGAAPTSMEAGTGRGWSPGWAVSPGRVPPAAAPSSASAPAPGTPPAGWLRERARLVLSVALR